MQHLAILESSTPDASEARRVLGRQLGAALQAATTDPARMLPLWTAFSRGEPVRADELRRAVGTQFVSDAEHRGLLVAVDVGENEPWLRGAVCIVAADVAGQLVWIASDFPWYDQDPQAVTGPGEASATLLAAVPDVEFRRVLDLGCGSGAVGVRLTMDHAGTLTASDVNPRALALTELTASLNDQTVRTVLSDFADDLDGHYDLLVCNPPFVLGRPSGHTTFRDSRDARAHASLALDLAPLLADRGLALYLTNWEYRLGADDPLDQLGEELRNVSDCDVLILERAVVPIAEYIALWSAEESERADWVDGFRRRDVAHLGTGIVAVRRSGLGEHAVTLAKDYDTPRDRLSELVTHWFSTGALHK